MVVPFRNTPPSLISFTRQQQQTPQPVSKQQKFFALSLSSSSLVLLLSGLHRRQPLRSRFQHLLCYAAPNSEPLHSASLLRSYSTPYSFYSSESPNNGLSAPQRPSLDSTGAPSAARSVMSPAQPASAVQLRTAWNFVEPFPGLMKIWGIASSVRRLTISFCVCADACHRHRHRHRHPRLRPLPPRQPPPPASSASCSPCGAGSP